MWVESRTLLPHLPNTDVLYPFSLIYRENERGVNSKKVNNRQKLVVHPGGTKSAIHPPPFPKDEKIEGFVIFTSNLVHKLLKIHHLLNETSQFDFIGLKNTIFKKFCPRYVRNFTFSPSLKKFLGTPRPKITIFFKP